MQQMYVGPTVPGVATKNRIYMGKLPDKVEERRNSDPYFANLLIPAEQLVTARQKLQDKNSVLAVSYLKVLNSLKGGPINYE